MRFKNFINEEHKIEIGSIVKGEGMSNSDLADMFASPTVKGLYLGDNRIYYNKSIYVIKNIVLVQNATPSNIKKAEEINKRLKNKHERERQKWDTERQIAKQIMGEIINVFKKFKLETHKTGQYIATPDKIEDINKELIKLGYVFKLRGNSMYYEHHNKPTIHVIRHDDSKGNPIKLEFYL